jgi:ATP-binding cassette subfamily B (MDR/TAP) protein 1
MTYLGILHGRRLSLIPASPASPWSVRRRECVNVLVTTSQAVRHAEVNMLKSPPWPGAAVLPNDAESPTAGTALRIPGTQWTMEAITSAPQENNSTVNKSDSNSNHYSTPAKSTSGMEKESMGTEDDGKIRGDPFDQLPGHEASVLRKQIEIPLVTNVTWSSLFRFSSRQDPFVIAVATICAIAAGAAVPLNTVILGSLAGAFQDFTNGISRAEFDDRVREQTLYFVYLAIGECQFMRPHPVYVA